MMAPLLNLELAAVRKSLVGDTLVDKVDDVLG